jgi:hypothetical protein
MMKVCAYVKRILCGVLLFANITAASATTIEQKTEIAEWTILIYVQAKNNLSRFATKNFTDIATVGSNKKLNLLVQWYQPNKQGIWRYKINKNKMELDSMIQSNTDGNQTTDLVDSMEWAKTKCPAQYYSLILWSHGVGILDPVWNGRTWVNINARTTTKDPQCHIAKLTEHVEMEKEIKQQIAQHTSNEHKDHRGILFNDESKTYTNNQQLVEALKQIKTKVLGNKKLDLLGMDACLMAMLEVVYQAKDYAKYLVASQEVELAYGWDYYSITHTLAQGNVTPVEFAQYIVLFYEQYYKERVSFYTQSAIDLEHVDDLNDNLNLIVNNLNECKKHDKNGIKQLIKQVRRSCIQFSTKSYVDLHSFYTQLSCKIDTKYIKKPAKNTTLLHAAQELKESLEIGKQLIETAVIVNVAGPRSRNAKGLSIYFPTKFIDKSYYQTEFVKNSLWLDVLNTYFEQ